eukprot:TRINITY_DN1328_c0_g1_i4.p1 TRINITY_DN1328_c0_g1~~TRINITY_DN1328_c0_g1_i4.p1  ORF type:complete len:451 (+),score=151.27 TRINITY_DN1328_c0_g1_i4:95-1447(+)
MPLPAAQAAAAARASTDAIYVIDPANRSGKIHVPREQTEPTLGLAEWSAARAAGRTKDVSLCMLYQKGRCLAGLGCHQIHADRDLVVQLRMMDTAGGFCCVEHSGGSLQEDDDSRVRMAAAPPVKVQLRERDTVTEVPAVNFARTLALPKALASALPIPCGRVCRLHQQGRCKYGRDCKNLHICRKMWQAMNGAAPRTLEPISCPQPAPVDLRQAAFPGAQRPVHVHFASGSAMQQQLAPPQQLRVLHIRPSVQQHQQPPFAVPLQPMVLQPLPGQGSQLQPLPGHIGDPGCESPAPTQPLSSLPCGSRSRSRSNTEDSYTKARQLATTRWVGLMQPAEPKEKCAPLTYDDVAAPTSPGCDSPPALLPASPVTSPQADIRRPDIDLTSPVLPACFRAPAARRGSVCGSGAFSLARGRASLRGSAESDPCQSFEHHDLLARDLLRSPPVAC